MWTVLTSHDVDKAVAKAPAEIVTRFHAWVAIARQSGPMGLRAVRGFRDEALSGSSEGFRSSRLNLQWRVIYRVEADELRVYAVRVSAHDYRRR